MKIHRVVVQIFPPRPEDNYPGQVEEAHYTVADGVVTLVDNAGVPILARYGKPYEKNLPPLGDAHLIAGRLAKEAWHARGDGKRDFNRPIHYPRNGSIDDGRGRHRLLRCYDGDPWAMNEAMTSSLTRILSTRMVRKN
jgi:hypothetical protein